MYEARGHIESIKDALPVDAIVTDSAGRIVDLQKERIDFDAIDTVLAELEGRSEMKLWIFDNLHKLQNRTLRNYEKKRSQV